MSVAAYILVAFLLIALNAFFVLAEFAIVKIRPTQIAPLAAKGHKNALRIQNILRHLDDYLSVCQVGITLTSIGLGFVGEPGFAALLAPLLHQIGGLAESMTEPLAVTLGFVIVSYLHIVLGELVPKSLAIRVTEKAVFLIAVPISFFRWLFIGPIVALNGTVNLLLRPFRLNGVGSHSRHSEEEIRTILGESESSGVMSFRRLLYLENVLDLGGLVVRNAMQVRSKLRCLHVSDSAENSLKTIQEYRFSRYPLLDDDPDRPIGFIHVKDLLFRGFTADSGIELSSLARPALKAREFDPLEQVLSTMQRTGKHMAFVYDNQENWTGIITMEDVLEEVVGSIEEEFPVDKPVTIASLLDPEHIFLDVPGATMAEVVQNIIKRLPDADLPLPPRILFDRIMERERQGSSFVGRHLALPCARLEKLSKPMVIFARLKEPITVPRLVVPQPGDESLRVIFLLLTPSTMSRIHQIILAHIATMYDSDFLEERLYEATTPQELRDIIATAEQVTTQ